MGLIMCWIRGRLDECNVGYDNNKMNACIM